MLLMAILYQIMVELFDSVLARPVSCTLWQYAITFCSQQEVARDVIWNVAVQDDGPVCSRSHYSWAIRHAHFATTNAGLQDLLQTCKNVFRVWNSNEKNKMSEFQSFFDALTRRQLLERKCLRIWVGQKAGNKNEEANNSKTAIDRLYVSMTSSIALKTGGVETSPIQISAK